MDERSAALVMVTAVGVGPVTARKLARIYGTLADAVRAALGAGDGARSLPGRHAEAIRECIRTGEHLAELSRIEAAGATFAVQGEAGYPQLLTHIAYPPIGLMILGEGLDALTPTVAVVGSRSASHRGMAVAGGLAFDLAREGVTVVSGLARGIDTAAHRGALKAGGKTIAVLGSGLDRIYPPENVELASEIATSGAVVSEFPMRSEPTPGCFPRRNRIVSGLSLGVIVVEAGHRSGALITAAHALEQGREVFAVPGPIDEPLSVGVNGLIKAGAKLVESVVDVMEELCGPLGRGPGHAAVRHSSWDADAGHGGILCLPHSGTEAGGPSELDHDTREPETGLLSPCPARGGNLESRICALLTLTPMSVDELAEAAGAGVPQILSTLMELELAGLASPAAGGRYVAGRRRRGVQQ